MRFGSTQVQEATFAWLALAGVSSSRPNSGYLFPCVMFMVVVAMRGKSAPTTLQPWVHQDLCPVTKDMHGGHTPRFNTTLLLDDRADFADILNCFSLMPVMTAYSPDTPVPTRMSHCLHLAQWPSSLSPFANPIPHCSLCPSLVLISSSLLVSATWLTSRIGAHRHLASWTFPAMMGSYVVRTKSNTNIWNGVLGSCFSLSYWSHSLGFAYRR